MFNLGGSFTARVVFLGGLAGQQRPRKGHAVADADGAHVQGERVERVRGLSGIAAARGDGIEHDEGRCCAVRKLTRNAPYPQTR